MRVAASYWYIINALSSSCLASASLSLCVKTAVADLAWKTIKIEHKIQIHLADRVVYSWSLHGVQIFQLGLLSSGIRNVGLSYSFSHNCYENTEWKETEHCFPKARLLFPSTVFFSSKDAHVKHIREWVAEHIFRAVPFGEKKTRSESNFL